MYPQYCGGTRPPTPGSAQAVGGSGIECCRVPAVAMRRQSMTVVNAGSRESCQGASIQGRLWRGHANTRFYPPHPRENPATPSGGERTPPKHGWLIPAPLAGCYLIAVRFRGSIVMAGSRNRRRNIFVVCLDDLHLRDPEKIPDRDRFNFHGLHIPRCWR